MILCIHPLHRSLIWPSFVLLLIVYLKPNVQDLQGKEGILRERVLSRLSWQVSLLRGLLWSWGPQLASHMEVTVVGSIGNFTNDSNCAWRWVVKQIPFALVPLRYLMTCLTCVRWPGDRLAVYFASRLVMVAISGRVEIVNQFRHPR
jgi:hypothetical protein